MSGISYAFDGTPVSRETGKKLSQGFDDYLKKIRGREITGIWVGELTEYVDETPDSAKNPLWGSW